MSIIRKRIKKYILMLLLVMSMLLSACSYEDVDMETEEDTVQEETVDADTELEEAPLQQEEGKQEEGEQEKQKKTKKKKKEKTKKGDKVEEELHYVYMEITVNSTITAAFSGLPKIEGVYLNGQQISASYGDSEGNIRNDCVACYCVIPDGSYRLTVKTDTFKPVSLDFEVSKMTRFNEEGDATNASDEEEAARYDLELKQKNFGKEVELKMVTPLEEWAELEDWEEVDD